MKWITRDRPKIDRIACPWLIKRFLDKEAEIIYVPFEEVLTKSKELGAIPFDIPDVEYTHYDDKCTFDYFLKKHKIKDPSLYILAEIVRGADTDNYNISPQSAGLWAIFSGLSYNIKDDEVLLETGLVIYDGLYSWAKYLFKQKHLVNSPFEDLLHNVYLKYLKGLDNKKRPEWVEEIKHIIQDQIDSQYLFDLKKISDDLDMNPSYLSREFSKYFDNLTFGEYIRKIRIDKSIDLIKSTKMPLTEIAYLTGFSDQSHFIRIFKKQTGVLPSSFRSNKKSKKSTKSN